MIIRNEYPRPQFVREDWQNLNGKWQFQFDDEDKGVSEKWYEDSRYYNKEIIVPFVYQSKASGIALTEPHDIVWYQREFEVKKNDKELVILHFGAVDYEADIYINGISAYHHVGGHTSFEVDITSFLTKGTSQTITVRAFDPHTDESIPRGKQIWEAESKGIWYTNSTGIWQSVWLEIVPESYIKQINILPKYDDGQVQIEAKVSKLKPNLQLKYQIHFKNKLFCEGSVCLTKEKLVFSVDLMQEYIFRTNYHNDGLSWTPESPNLFDISFTLTDNISSEDNVAMYFGFRKVHQKNGMIFLNNKPYYQKLVLDQGYFPEGLLTAPTDEDLRQDIILAKEMGFNGCRKHQKIEDPRFLYWADKLGYLVWGECASPIIYNSDSVTRLTNEWTEIVERDFNHPCIVTWVPINESWGVPNIQMNRMQQHFSQAMYHLVHSLDETRLVISNDGWSLTETDICAIHNYSHGTSDEIEKYQLFSKTLLNKENILSLHPSPWEIYADGFSYKGEPILLTEFGGIGFALSNERGWGYTSVDNAKDFVAEYSRIMTAVYASEILYGYCYTQLTDVEQEINGILTYDRKPKCDLTKIKAINDRFNFPTINA